MRPGLIKTDNVVRGLAALEELKRAAREYSGRRALVVEGLTGRGKTVFVRWYAVQRPEAVYVEANADWTASWLMRDLAGALGLPRKHSVEANYRQVVAAARREEEAGRLRVAILDEFDRVGRSARLLETVRGLHDAGLPLVLVGEAGAWSRVVRKSPRFADRVSQVVTFEDVRVREVLACALELCDLRLTEELAGYICRQAEGNFRRAAKVLEELERQAKAAPGELDRGRVDAAIKNLRLAEKKAAA